MFKAFTLPTPTPNPNPGLHSNPGLPPPPPPTPLTPRYLPPLRPSSSPSCSRSPRQSCTRPTTSCRCGRRYLVITSRYPVVTPSYLLQVHSQQQLINLLDPATYPPLAHAPLSTPPRCTRSSSSSTYWTSPSMCVTCPSSCSSSSTSAAAASRCTSSRRLAPSLTLPLPLEG